jgi:hypothetical protein
MRCVLTTCTAAKDLSAGLLPAGRRYRGPRVELAEAWAADLRAPLLFVSGRYGLLSADDPIPWYDEALMIDKVPALIGPVGAALRQRGLRWARVLVAPPGTPGWGPYEELIGRAAEEAGVELAWARMPGPDPAGPAAPRPVA